MLVVDDMYIKTIREQMRKAMKVQQIKAVLVNGPLEIETKEGKEMLKEGEQDWLVEAIENDNERYFIYVDRFYELYEETKEKGFYRRKWGKYVNVYQMKETFMVRVEWLDAFLYGKGGDYLVEYGKGDYNIVDQDTFHRSYIIVENENG